MCWASQETLLGPEEGKDGEKASGLAWELGLPLWAPTQCPGPGGGLLGCSHGLFQELRKPLPFRDWEADWGRKKGKSKQSKPRQKWPTPGTSLAVQWLRLCLPMWGEAGLIPGQGTKTRHALGAKHQNIRQKQYCNKFNKDFKNHPHPKKKKANNLKKMANTRFQNMRDLCTEARRNTCQTSF